MSEGLDKLAGAIGDTLKTAPTLYEDALQPTVQEVGKIVERIPRAINAAFSGLDKWILNKENSIDETKKLLELKLQNIDPEKIVEPDAYVAVPTIQAISYSMNSDELRNLYANLLAKAMNSDTKEHVHPAFVDIIKQLSPADVRVFEEISSNNSFQTLDMYYGKYQHTHDPSNPFSELESPVEKRGYEGLTYITNISPNIVNVSLENILRLSLIEERFSFNDESLGERIKQSPLYKRYFQELQKFNADPYWKYEENIHTFYLSHFGKAFRSICLDIS